MDKNNTLKLFYNEYANKLVVHNQLAHLFRERQWGAAKTHLDKLQHSREQGERLEWKRGRIIDYIDVQHLQEAQVLYNELYRKKDIKIRVENPRMQIYSNDLTFLEKLSTKITNCTELWSPSEEFPLLAANTIVLSRPMEYEYRVTLSGRTSQEFANWIDNNLDKIKIGKRCIEAIRRGHYTQGLYFYVRSERYLSLLQLVIGDSIQRIDKVIYKQNVDK